MTKKKKSDYEKFLKDIKKNYWAISTIVLAILLVVILINGVGHSSGVGAKRVSQNVLAFANAQGANAKLVNTTDEGSLYLVVLSIPSQDGTSKDIPVYVTKDGKNLIPQLIPIETQIETHDRQNSNSNNIPKTNKPKVELYVFSYCPYGTQSEKGIIPVVKLLGNKIDFKIRQIGAMHGPHEELEAKRQLCIEKEDPSKLLDYILSFDTNAEIGACNSNATCSTPLVDKIYTHLGINKAKIEACIASDGDSLYAAEEANSKSHRVSGSPTLIINGVNAQSKRDSASYLATICSAFSNAPEECSQTMSSASPSPGFGGSTTSTSSNAHC